MNTHNSRKLHSLVIFRNILKDETIKKLVALFDCDEKNKNELTDKYCDFAQSLLSHGGNLSQYFLKLILEDENLYTTYKITGRGDGELLELTKKEYELLAYLASNRNKPFTREELLEQVWGYEDFYGDIRTVDVTIRRLREKLELDPSRPEYLMTKRGVGYYIS